MSRIQVVALSLRAGLPIQIDGWLGEFKQVVPVC
jgi:hypothetical protein